MKEIDRGGVMGRQIWGWICTGYCLAVEPNNLLNHQSLVQIGRRVLIEIVLACGSVPAIAAPPIVVISDTEISKLAKESTIKITAPTVVFSGTIVYRNNNVYTVVTSAANFKANPQTRYLAT